MFCLMSLVFIVLNKSKVELAAEACELFHLSLPTVQRNVCRASERSN